MRKTPPRGRAWAGQPRREAPWGPAGRCQITFSTVFLATLGYFFLPGNPVRAPTVRWDSGKSPQIRDGGPHGQSGQRGAGGPRGEMDVRGGARPPLRRPAGPSSPASDHPPTLPPAPAPAPAPITPLHHPCTYPDLRKWLDVKQFGYHKTIVRAPPSWGRLLLTRVGPVGPAARSRARGTPGGRVTCLLQAAPQKAPVRALFYNEPTNRAVRTACGGWLRGKGCCPWPR